MKKVYSDFIQFRGSHYDFGYFQGEQLKNSLILSNRKKQWGSRPHHFIINEKKYKHVIKQFAPGILDELHGLADALKQPLEDAIREFGGYYLEYVRGGCSIFTGNDYMVRNYDSHPHGYEGRYLLYQPTDHGYATIGPTMQVTGRTDGMNEKGLAMGYNFVNRRQSEDGFMCNMIGRIILENCATIDDAVNLLKEIPHRHSFSYSVIDKNGQSIVIEASSRKVVTTKATACTNHFEKLTEENRYRMDESIHRKKAIETEGGKIVDSYEAFQMLNEIDRGIFSLNYGAFDGTLHTASYHPQELVAGIALGGDRKPLLIDFKQWLDGKDFHITKIRGSLPAGNAFINMEKL